MGALIGPRQWGPPLSVGVLQHDSFVAIGKEVAPVDCDPGSIGPRTGERPFCYSVVSSQNVATPISPPCIRHVSKDHAKGGSDLRPAGESLTTNLIPAGGFKDTVISEQAQRGTCRDHVSSRSRCEAPAVLKAFAVPHHHLRCVRYPVRLNDRRAPNTVGATSATRPTHRLRWTASQSRRRRIRRRETHGQPLHQVQRAGARARYTAARRRTARSCGDQEKMRQERPRAQAEPLQGPAISMRPPTIPRGSPPSWSTASRQAV